MRILIISHTVKENIGTNRGRWIILSELFSEKGHQVMHVLRHKWGSMCKRINEFRPDVIISVGLVGGIVACLKKAGLIKKPLIHDWNDIYEDTFTNTHPLKIALLQYCAITYSDIIISPSRYLLSKTKKKKYYIPHGVWDYNDVKPYKFKTKNNFLYVGEISEKKGVFELTNACMHKKNHLYLIGGKDKNIPYAFPHNVHYLGRVEPAEVPKYIKGADVCVHTADQDCSLKLFEYLYYRKPILAKRGKVNYLLNHSETAYLTDDWEEGITELSENDLIHIEFESGLRKFKVYTWPEIADMYLNIIKEAL